MTDNELKTQSRRQLPDYEETLRKNARRILLEAGIPADRVDAEWERLRQQPLPFDLPTDEELDAMGRLVAAKQPDRND